MGTHICTEAGASHDESLLPLSPHLSLAVDWVAGNPTLEGAIRKGLVIIIGEKRICESNISVPSIHWKNLHRPCFYKINNYFNHTETKGWSKYEYFN
jgi:hypothetical protein